jgi:hypothetical protein
MRNHPIIVQKYGGVSPLSPHSVSLFVPVENREPRLGHCIRLSSKHRFESARDRFRLS